MSSYRHDLCVNIFLTVFSLCRLKYKHKNNRVVIILCTIVSWWRIAANQFNKTELCYSIYTGQLQGIIYSRVNIQVLVITTNSSENPSLFVAIIILLEIMCFYYELCRGRNSATVLQLPTAHHLHAVAMAMVQHLQ